MANAQREISMVFKAYDEFTLHMERMKVSAEQALGSIGQKATWLKDHWMGASAAIYAAMATIHKGWDMMDAAANFQEQKTALNNLTSEYGVTASAMLASIQGAAGGTISQIDAVVVANRGFLEGLNPAQIEFFAGASKRLGDALGGNLTERFTKLNDLVATGSTKDKVLKAIVGDLTDEYKKYGRELTAAEKVTINARVAQERLEAAMKRMGPDVMTAADAMAELKAIFKDIVLWIGTKALVVVLGAASAFLFLGQTVSEVVSWIADTLAPAVAFFEDLASAVGLSNKNGVSHAFKDFAKAVQGGADESQRMQDKVNGMIHALTKEDEVMRGVTKAHGYNNEIKQEASAINKSLAEQVLSLQKETNKLIMTEAEYFKWETDSLRVKGASLEAINALTAAQHDLNKAKLKEAEIKAVAEARKSLGEGAQQAPGIIGGLKPSAEEAEARDMRKNINALQEYYGKRAQLLITAGATENEIKQNTEEANFVIQDQTTRLEFATREQTSLQRLLSMEAVETARVNILGAANKSMEAQMLRMVEVGKFSAAEFGKTVIQAVKMELIGLAARAAVLSLFYTAMAFIPGYQYAAVAAVGFAAASVAAYAAAAGVQALFGGTAAGAGVSSSMASTGGGAQPSFNATPAGYPMPVTSQTTQAPVQNVTVNIQNGQGNAEYWKDMIVKNIAPAMRDAVGDNLVINLVTA